MADPPGNRGPKTSPVVPAKKIRATQNNGASVHDQQPAHQTLQLHNPHTGTQQLAHRPAAKTRKETADKIEKLIKRLLRQYLAHRPSDQVSFLVPPRPPDLTAASLGGELADAFLQTFDYSASDSAEFEPLRQRILASLKHRGIHPSLPHAFFAHLTATTAATATPAPNTTNVTVHENVNESWEWLPKFILDCEQTILEELPNTGGSAYEEAEASGLNETMAAAIRAYALSSAARAAASRHPKLQQQQQYQHQANSTTTHNESLNTTYRRMQSSAARTMLLREFSRAVGELPLIPCHLSPLMASCVLTLWATPYEEKSLLLQELWRQCWDVIYASSNLSEFWSILTWMTEALYIMLLVMPSAGRLARDDRPAWRELAQSWLMEMANMIAFVVHATNTDDEHNVNTAGNLKHGTVSSERMLADWLQLVLNKLLPILSTQGTGTYRISLEPFWEQLNGLIVEIDDALIQLDTITVFRLSTMALSTPLTGETKSILTLFSYLLPSESAFARGLTSTVGAIYLQEESCQPAARHLLKTSQGIDQQLMGLSDRSNSKTNSVVQLLEEGDVEVLTFIAGVRVSALANLSAVKQVEVLLLGISMMEIVGNEGLRTLARRFVKDFLQTYPHLGLLLMPSLIADINAASVETSPKELLDRLQFLSESVTVDPSCAQQAWNLLGVQMLNPSNPVALRVMILRLLPRLCEANKRLYNRVIGALGDHRDGKSSRSSPEALSPDSMVIDTAVMEVRLAVAASICDLAKGDEIRDTSDCIGWIQEFLVIDFTDSPAKALLVHYAIMTLHYLVVAQELDFNLVLKVLKKKLCAVQIEAVQHLPPVIQEALALLLGDGECEFCDRSSDEDKEKELEPPETSAQVVGSVNVLIALGAQYENIKPNGDTSREMIARILRNTYYSLSRYSLDALGLDSDGIKAAILWQEQGDQRGENPPQAASRYVSLRDLAANSIQSPAGMRGMVEDFDPISQALISKILCFEEEALSVSLWATKGTKQSHFQQRRGETGKPSAKDGSSLPAASKIQSLHKRMPSSSSSIARLLCFEGKQFKQLLLLAGEVSFEEREPSTIVLLVQAWLNACSRILSQLCDGAKINNLNQAIEEIERWGHQTGNNDAMYLTMGAIAVYLPAAEEKNEYGLIDRIQTEVFNAFKSLQFHNTDIAKISIALTAISSLRRGQHERALQVIVLLENTCQGYGGQLSFGASYGLSILAQAIANSPVSSGDSRVLKSKIGQVAGFLVGELLLCTEETNVRSDVLRTLVACLQSGVSTPGLVNTLADSVSQHFSISLAKSATAKYLFISLSLCLPSLSQVNGDLLLGTLFLLERFQWGSSKGIALVPVLVEAKATGVLTDDEYNVIVTDYSRLFEQGSGISDNLHSKEDLFYAVSGTSSRPSPHVIRQYLTESSHIFDDDRLISPLLGATISVCSFPCLGSGKVFSAPPQLRHDIPRLSIDNVLEVLTSALDAHTDYSSSVYSKNAVVLMGLLASTKNQPSEIISLAPTKEKVASHSTSRLKSLTLDFALLPTARQGTLLHDVMRLIEDAHSGHTADMIRYMRCLEPLSLPGHFAKHMLEPLFSEISETTKECCVSLLSAQISRRRKAIFDGKDFTNMALQVCISPLVSFNTLLGSGKAALKFVKCLEGVVRLPTELVVNGASNLWEVCLSLSNDEAELLVNFLNSVRNILKEQGKRGKQSGLSQKTMSFLEELISSRVFSDLRDLSWGASIGENNATEERSILKAYVACLSELPLSTLEKFDVFVFHDDDSFSGEMFRTLVVLALVRGRYFNDGARAMREFSKVLAWFSRKYISPGAELYLETLRRMSCALAAATAVLSASERREILLTIFEQLLLCQATAALIGLDLLACMLASWSSDVAQDGGLSMAYICKHSTEELQGLSDTALGRIFALFQHDLPSNLATYGRREKISAIIANQLWRLHSTWTRHDADQEVLACLQKAFICGSSSETKEEDFVALTCSILLKADNLQLMNGGLLG